MSLRGPIDVRTAARRVAEHGRGVGATDLLHGQADWPVVVLFALVSQLGDVWFLFLLSGVLYVAGEFTPRRTLERRRGLFVFALLLTYVALIGVLKDVFVLPRPPGATEPLDLAGSPVLLDWLFADITTASGPGFPSGHALGTTMVWGGLALVTDRWSGWVRVGVTTAAVVLVSLSRLVLGVHYLVDVLVGALVGLVVLLALYWFSQSGRDPGRVLGVAVVVGALGLLQNPTFDSVAALGGAIGGWITWHSIAESVKPHPSHLREVIAGFAVLVLAAAFFAIVYTLEVSHVFTFFATAVAVGTAIASPLLGERAV